MVPDCLRGAWRGLLKAAFATALLLPPIAQAQPALKDYLIAPSLLPGSGEDLPLLIGVSGAARVNDADELLAELLDLVEEARGLAAQSESGILLLDFQTDSLNQQMRELDGRVATARGTLGAITQAPWLPPGWFVSATGNGRLAGTFKYDPEDEQRLNSAVMTAGLSGADLRSQVQSAGVATVELALHNNRELAWLPGFSVGSSFKYQYLLLHERNINLVEYEEDDLFDVGRDTEEHHFANIDLAVTTRAGGWTLTAALQNLIPGEFDGPISGRYRLRPNILLHATTEFGFGRLSLNADLLKREGFSHVPEERHYGVELRSPVHEKLDLIAAYRHIDNDVDSAGAELGFNYHLLEYFQLSTVVEFAGRREAGVRAAVQFFF